MKLYSKHFNDYAKISWISLDTFIANARHGIHFDPDRVADLVYFSHSIYHQKHSLFKSYFTKTEFLVQIADLLRSITVDQLLSLTDWEIKQVLHFRFATN